MYAPKFVWDYMRFVLREIKSDFPDDAEKAAIAEDTARHYIKNYERGLIVLDEVMQAISCLRRAIREAE